MVTLYSDRYFRKSSAFAQRPARLAPRQREAVDCGLQRISAWYERWRDMMSTISTKHGAKIYYNMVNEDLLGFLKT